MSCRPPSPGAEREGRGRAREAALRALQARAAEVEGEVASLESDLTLALSQLGRPAQPPARRGGQQTQQVGKVGSGAGLGSGLAGAGAGNGEEEEEEEEGAGGAEAVEALREENRQVSASRGRHVAGPGSSIPPGLPSESMRPPFPSLSPHTQTRPSNPAASCGPRWRGCSGRPWT